MRPVSALDARHLTEMAGYLVGVRVNPHMRARTGSKQGTGPPDPPYTTQVVTASARCRGQGARVMASTTIKTLRVVEALGRGVSDCAY